MDNPNVELLQDSNVNQTMQSIHNATQKKIVSFIPTLTLGDFTKVKADKTDITNGDINVVNTHNSLLMSRRLYPEYTHQGVLELINSLPFHNNGIEIIYDVNRFLSQYGIKAVLTIQDDQSKNLEKEILIDIVIEGDTHGLVFDVQTQSFSFQKQVSLTNIGGK